MLQRWGSIGAYDPHTRKREITSLNEAMRELTHTSGMLITRDEEEEITTESGRIDVLPLWRFLLNPLRSKEFDQGN